MKPPFRHRVPFCASPDSFRYYLALDQINPVWEKLSGRYGALKKESRIGTLEIRCEKFIFKSALTGNPITVLRRRKCKPEDVLEMHALIGFNERVHQTI